MLQESVGRPVNQRPPRNFAASGGAHPFGLHKHVERALGGLDPTDSLDFSQPAGPVIVYHRQQLSVGAGPVPRIVVPPAHTKRQVGRPLQQPSPTPTTHDTPASSPPT